MFRVDVEGQAEEEEGGEGEKEKEGGNAAAANAAAAASKNPSSSSSLPPLPLPLPLPLLPPPPFSGVPVVVDATQTGGAARFINHSCDPNCTTRAHADGGTETVLEYVSDDDDESGGDGTGANAAAKTKKRKNVLVAKKVSLRLPRVGVVARRDIAAGEELTYDYQFEPEPDEPAIECHCGAGECRGRLN